MAGSKNLAQTSLSSCSPGLTSDSKKKKKRQKEEKDRKTLQKDKGSGNKTLSLYPAPENLTNLTQTLSSISIHMHPHH